jgi:hypothetical protein
MTDSLDRDVSEDAAVGALHRVDRRRIAASSSRNAVSTMKIVDQSGTSETHVWETGKAYWLPKNPPNTMHSDVNAGERPIEVMVVEIEDDK